LFPEKVKARLGTNVHWSSYKCFLENTVALVAPLKLFHNIMGYWQKVWEAGTKVDITAYFWKMMNPRILPKRQSVLIAAEQPLSKTSRLLRACQLQCIGPQTVWSKQKIKSSIIDHCVDFYVVIAFLPW